MAWIVEWPGGDWSAHASLDGVETGGATVREVSRLPAEGERPDPDGEWRACPVIRKAVKDGVTGVLGIAVAHARKAVEAESVLAGGPGPLIEAEAAARGITAADLAGIVRAKNEASIAAELDRLGLL